MGKNIKVLLVEDDLIDQMAFKRMVKDSGLSYDYAVAGCVSEAKEMLTASNFDVIITDYMLPDGSAFDVISIKTDAPIIFATGAGDEGTAVNAMKAGAYDYLIKDHERNYLKILPVTVEKALKSKEAEQRLRLLNAAVENANDSIIILEAEPSDLPGRKILYVNKAFTRITGYEAYEVLGKTLRMLNGINTDAAELAKANLAFEERKPITIEIANYKKDGTEFWVESNIVPFAEERGWYVHWVSVQRDITQRKEFEDAMRLSKEAAEEASQAKSDFLSTVSHELRTPLTSVLGFTTIVKEDLEGFIFPNIKERDNKMERKIRNVSESLDIMEKEAMRLTNLINDVLDIAKIEAGKIDWKDDEIDMRDVFLRAVSATASLHEPKGIKIEEELIGDDFKFFGDGDRMIQVATNLFSNAIKFTESGTITYMIKHSADELRCEVIDTGIGIPEDMLEKVFEKFKQIGDTLTSKPQGTGLGLPICKEIIEHHGGKIWAESNYGKGSTFIFTIPTSTKKDSELGQKDALLKSIKDLSRF
ncbi:MAG: PAS domain S-box protein [Nitrospirae bacterium]|nr:PAS domain S-box protein [Nitrospirota bacterium]